MKKYPIVLFLLLAIYSLKAQDYRINFAGTGESTRVGNVTVENLSQGTNTTLDGEAVLHLLGTSTGLKPNLDDVDKSLTIYPNPTTEKSTIEFVAIAPGLTTIDLFDITGKRVASVCDRLTIARHSYIVSGLQTGIYTVKIYSPSYSYAGKLLSMESPGSGIRILYNGFSAISATTQKLKSASAEITMQYTNGDLLKITGNSGNYSTIIMDVPTESKTLIFTFIACSDADGNNYPVVKIGNQWWIAENQKTTSFNDGSSIPLVTDNNVWANLKTPGYCWYKNDEFNKDTYGALYNWFAVNTGKLAPEGWHVPTDEEWTMLTTSLEGEDLAGGKLKATGTSNWIAKSKGASNSSGFTGLPGGYRDYNGLFHDVNNMAVFWSASGANTGDAWLRELHYSYDYVNRFDWYQVHGYSVRCLKEVIGSSLSPMEINVSGGDAWGSGGSVSFSVGYLTTTTSEGANGSVILGIQQPYEILVAAKP
jgi:uncharacterized protein (TIGR02145 family)